jgi:hypothetical protein
MSCSYGGLGPTAQKAAREIIADPTFLIQMASPEAAAKMAQVEGWLNIPQWSGCKPGSEAGSSVGGSAAGEIDGEGEIRVASGAAAEGYAE